jgi:hypothetical protein
MEVKNHLIKILMIFRGKERCNKNKRKYLGISVLLKKKMKENSKLELKKKMKKNQNFKYKFNHILEKMMMNLIFYLFINYKLNNKNNYNKINK